MYSVLLCISIILTVEITDSERNIMINYAFVLYKIQFYSTDFTFSK